MSAVQYFKAQKQTNRFRQNQRVWVRADCGNHLKLFFRWRGSGRYVSGVEDKFSPVVGEIKTIEVDESFANRINGGDL
jgi:hypothetical protein